MAVDGQEHIASPVHVVIDQAIRALEGSHCVYLTLQLLERGHGADN